MASFHMMFIKAQKSGGNVIDLPLIFTFLRISGLRVYTIAHC